MRKPDIKVICGGVGIGCLAIYVAMFLIINNTI